MRTLFLLSVVVLLFDQVLSQQPAWRLANGTAGNWVDGVDFVRRSPDTMYALCRRNFMRSIDRGENWDSLSWAFAHYGGMGIDPRDPQVIYIAIDGIIAGSNDPYVSTNGGRTWRGPLFFGAVYPVKVIEFDPVELGTVYIGVGPFVVYRTSNIGQTWDTLGRPSNGYYLNCLSIAHSNNRILYEGYIGGVARSNDRGATWTSLNLGIQPSDGVFVAVDPHDANVVYAGVWSLGTDPGGMYKTTDGGTVWNEINNGITSQDWQVQAIAINPEDPNEVLVGIESDQHIMLRTTDAGAKWDYFVDGMAGRGVVNAITFDTVNDRVYAAVILDGGGLYIQQRLTGVPSEPTNKPNHIELYQNYPNPFNPTTTISFTTQDVRAASVKIFDIVGREVMSLLDQRIGGGKHSVVLDAASLSSGTYFYTLRVDDFIATKRMILLR